MENEIETKEGNDGRCGCGKREESTLRRVDIRQDDIRTVSLTELVCRYNQKQKI